MKEPLELLELCKGHAMTYEERRKRKLLRLFPLGYYMDPNFVYGSAKCP